MASNIDKVEEKVEEDVEEAIKTSKTRREMERKLDTNDVSYKIKEKQKKARNRHTGQISKTSSFWKGR
jgi:hypothetical protein